MKEVKEKLKVAPNLVDYNKIKKKFSWKDYQKELHLFKNNKINAAYNAVTRHAQSTKTALLWESSKGINKTFTFSELDKLSNKVANALTRLGVKKGERVFLFLPRIPETYISFLGILKVGAIAGTLFQAFGEAALLDRLANSGASYVITHKSLKKRIEKIRKKLPKLKKVIIVGQNKVNKGELSYNNFLKNSSTDFTCKKMNLEDPAFMLYTSGTTGKPKGVIHTHGAILQQHLTTKWVLDLKEKDTYWCTADPGWVTGISYTILGNWSNQITTLIYEGRFDAAKWYKLISKHKVSVWYTAPTAIRMLIKAGPSLIKKQNLKSLRHICSVGEPLNPIAIRWGLKHFKLPIYDTWWQTETGAIMVANYPGMKIKLGSMGKPFPGIQATVRNNNGKRVVGKEGNLTIKEGWPSMMKKIWRRPKKYNSYFKNGWYYTGDKAIEDKYGYFWFVGRSDDIIKTKGERVGPFEVESALLEFPGIVEAGVIGKPHKLYGEIIKAFVVFKAGHKIPNNLQEKVKAFIKKKLAGHIYPSEIEIRKDLPKTRSGKIMRRLLKSQDLGLPTGDVSGLEK